MLFVVGCGLFGAWCLLFVVLRFVAWLLLVVVRFLSVAAGLSIFRYFLLLVVCMRAFHCVLYCFDFLFVCLVGQSVGWCVVVVVVVVVVALVG